VNEHSLRDAYDQALRSRDTVEQSASLPLDRLESLVSREGTEAERLRTLDVAMSSAEGRREFEVAWAAARAARVPKQRFSVPRWTAAAAAVVLSVSLGVLWQGRPPVAAVTETLRGAASPIELISPRGNQVRASGTRFAWHRVSTAGEYTVVIVDRAGNEVFATNTADTLVQLPDSIVLQPDTEYLWWVQAQMSDGSQLSAVTETIRVAKPKP
jgi:hypothetical protein